MASAGAATSAAEGLGDGMKSDVQGTDQGTTNGTIYSIRGVSYNVRCIGSGEPLLLIHGFTGSIAQWEPLAASLSRTYQLIMVDMLGHGSSDAPLQVERYSTFEVVEDLAELLQMLGHKQVHVLGYSMGGRIALSFAMQKRELVRSLIMESSSPGLASEEERLARTKSDQALAKRIEQQGIEWFADYWGKLPLFSSMLQLPEARQKQLHELRLRNRPFGLAQSLRGIGTGVQPSWWQQLDELMIPVLLIAGELDTKYCHIAKQMQGRLPQAQLEIVPGAGHNVHVEQPHLFDTIIKRFLDKKGMV